MKKALIITLFDNNYGNKLQNYALQEILKENQIEAYTLRIAEERKSFKYIIQKLIYLISKKFVLNKWPKAYRRISFELFTKQNIKTLSIKEYSRDTDDFNYVFFGSDQIWNLSYNVVRNNYEYYFGDVFKKSRKIAISSSLGIDYIPEEYKKSVFASLKTFYALSMRENTGKYVMLDLCENFAIDVLLDPTFILSKDKWFELSSCDDKKSKYVLLYFLGKTPKYVNDYLEENYGEYDVINVAKLTDPLYYAINPFEFIKKIRYAELVLTDSFHACVFSIIFNKNFLVVPRDGNGAGMESRIFELLSRFKLENHMFYENINPEYKIINYDEISKIIDCERIKFYEYITRALSD